METDDKREILFREFDALADFVSPRPDMRCTPGTPGTKPDGGRAVMF